MATYGQRAACKHCGQDIEYHGRQFGWIDRGAGRQCLPYIDRQTREIVTPTGTHEPYVYTPPPETPNDREALRLQIEADARLQSWRERGVL